MVVDFTIEDSVGYITIQRAEMSNAISTKMREQYLIPMLKQCRDSDDVNVVVLRSEGDDVFSAGGDLKEVAEFDFDFEKWERITSSWEEVLWLLQTMDKPTVVQADGHALAGGAILLLYSDIVVASESAYIKFPEIDVGIMEWFSTTVLPRYIGPKKAMYYWMTGEPMSMVEAERLGLVSKLVADDEVEGEVAALTETLVAKNPQVLGEVKEAMNVSLEMSPTASFYHVKQKTLSRERARETPNYQRGIEDYLESRDDGLGS